MSRKACCRVAVAASVLAVLASLAAGAQVPLTLEDLIEKNVQASGGKERLARVQNLAFKIGASRYVVASDGRMKILTGKDPVVTDVVLVGSGAVRRNSLKGMTELTGNEKAAYLALAKLYAGVFTLDKFAKELQFLGLRSYGSEKLYQVSAPFGSLAVDFFLQADNFLLKRMVFHGATPEGDKYEINYDFGPFEPVEGYPLPQSWFSSQVGTRGNLSELTEVKLNVPLADGFFSVPELNAGTVAASAGVLKGNILDFSSPPGGLTIVTNWVKKNIDDAGLRTQDPLILTVGGMEIELVLYTAANELPRQPDLAKGARLLAPAPRGGETFAVQLFGVETSQIMPRLKVLDPIEIKKR